MSKKTKSEGDENGHPFAEVAKELFATHNCAELYFTTDGTAFTQEQHARIHAGFLKDNKVITIKRQEAE